MSQLAQKWTNLFNGITLMIFDFDCTITNFHLSSNSTLEDVSSRPLDEFIEASLFRSFVKYLLEHKIQVAIASYGKKELILGLMNRIFPDPIFHQENVATPRDISLVKSIKWSEGCNPSKKLSVNKNDMIQLLAQHLGQDREGICLLDDTEEHIENARSLGYRAILVPKCEKFRETLRTLLRHFLVPDETELFIRELDPSSTHNESD